MNSAAPYSPRLATTIRGPSSIAARGGAGQVRLLGQHAQLGIVEQQAVDLADRGHERVARRLYPEVHRVERDEPGAVALGAHAALELGLDVAQEDDIRGLRRVRELGLEVAEDVELGVVGVRDVEVVLVVAAPEEGLAALDVLDVARLDAASMQHLELVLAEVVADRPDDADVGEEARGEREMHGGAAQHPVALAEGRAHGVEGD